MISRRGFLAGSATLLAVPLAAEAQQAAKAKPKIGVLSPAIGRNPIEEVFEQALQSLGWEKDQGVAIEERYAGGRQDTIAPLATELVNLGVDVLVAWGPHCALAAKAATVKIPIVFLVVGDPVEAGLVPALGRPGGNLTGITEYASLEVHAKRIQLLQAAVPGIRRILVLRSLEDTQTRGAKRSISAGSKTLGLEVLERSVDTPAALSPALRKARAEGAQGIYVFPSGFAFSYAPQISEVALANQLPSVYPFREGAIAGAMLSYATSLSGVARRGAAYVDMILKGKPVRGIPIEQATDYELIINLKTAKALGLTIPPSLLLRADQVID